MNESLQTPDAAVGRLERAESRPAAHAPGGDGLPARSWIARAAESLFGNRSQAISLATSFMVHFWGVILLALLTQQADRGQAGIGSLRAAFEMPESLDTNGLDDDSQPSVPVDLGSSAADDVQQVVTAPRLTDLAATNDFGPLVRPQAESTENEDPSAADAQGGNDGSQDGGKVSGIGLGIEGRKGDMRITLLKERGGNEKSEKAVEMGLRWLQAHQLDDGSWSFDHTKGLCQGLCHNPGSNASSTGATALALLPFLGANNTPKEGQYKDVVQKGIYYLTTRAVVGPNGADVQEGTMYAQGITTIALCEAYAMTGDPALKDLAERCVQYILYAQDRKGGGWRYVPGEPGDTTVTGWQFMALKSAQMAGIEVPSPAITMADHFLDGVQWDKGSRYGYRAPGSSKAEATTAVGLLCRMYSGWGPYNPALARGAAHLNKWGPSKENIYYDYYATQVLCHLQGSHWDRWNRKMRDSLISLQRHTGHENGSWFYPMDEGSRAGGRLYCTAMSIMTLEVYYRYLPLYSEEAIKKSL